MVWVMVAVEMVEVTVAAVMEEAVTVEVATGRVAAPGKVVMVLEVGEEEARVGVAAAVGSQLEARVGNLAEVAMEEVTREMEAAAMEGGVAVVMEEVERAAGVAVMPANEAMVEERMVIVAERTGEAAVEVALAGVSTVAEEVEEREKAVEVEVEDKVAAVKVALKEEEAVIGVPLPVLEGGSEAVGAQAVAVEKVKVTAVSEVVEAG